MGRNKQTRRMVPKAPPAKPLSTRIKPVPDLLDRANLRALLEPKPRGYPLPGSVKPALTPQQDVIAEAGRAAAELLQDDNINNTFISLVTVRRMYIVLYRRLQELLEAKNKVAELPPAVQDFLIQYMLFAASKPFDEHDLMDGVTKTLLPCLVNVIDRHTEADEAAEQKAQDAAEEERKLINIPIGFTTENITGARHLTRSQSLVLVGWRNAVNWLLKLACTAALTDERLMVLFFRSQLSADQKEIPRVLNIGPTAWGGCANSKRAMNLLTENCLAERLNRPVDLLICDNLPTASTKTFVGRLPAAAGGDAHRHLRTWCNAAGCAFLGAIPGDDRTTPNITGQEYEQLRTFADLRAVSVLTADDGLPADHYRVIVGNHAAVFDVPITELVACGKPLLIDPTA